jgi:hypothetical protein
VTSLTRRGDIVVVTGNANALNAVTSVLARNEVMAEQLRVDQANLEDAFVALTGRGLHSASSWASVQGRALPATHDPKETVMSVPAATLGAGTPRSAFAKLTLTEAKLFLRERVGVIWGVGFPLVLLIIFGSIPAFRQPSEATVKTHLLHIYAKLGVSDRAAAVAEAFDRGLLTPGSR